MSPIIGLDPGPALSSDEQRDIVPAYFRPHLHESGSKWRRLASVMKPRSIAIMNPQSGPGAELDPEYVGVIDLCHSYRRQLRVIGYVGTDHGRTSLSNVMEDLKNYVSWYPHLDGIFLDEMNNDPIPDVRSYYTAISAKIRERRNQTIVGNPGNVSDAQGAWSFDVVDVLVAQENRAADYLAWEQPQWVYPGSSRDHAYRIAHLVHGVRPSMVGAAPSQEKKVLAASRVRHAGYVYATDEAAPPDPRLWDRLPVSWTKRLALPLPPTRG